MRSKNNSNYCPHPLDTKEIVLPDELMELSEEISRNVHEVWSKGRIDDGWTYAEEMDEDKKTHPLLVPYEELPESEKDYDRRTSQETIKMIVALGFCICKK